MPAKRQKLRRWERGLGRFVIVLAGLVLLFLLQQSVFLTTQDTITINTGYTRGFYSADPAPWAHLAVFVLLAVLARYLARRRPVRRSAAWPAAAAMACVGAVLLLWMVLGCRLRPNDDPYMVFVCAEQLLQGETGSLGPQGYLNLYPNQLFLVLYDMPFAALFGEEGMFVLQAVNVLWWLLAVIFFALAAARLFGTARSGTYACLLLGCIPMALGVTFIYGTLPGLALSAVQVWALAHCLRRDGGAAAPGWYTAVAVCGALAALLKQNYLIISIAAMLYLGWQAVRGALAAGAGGLRRAALPLAAIAALLALYAGGGALTERVLYAGTGLEPGGGKPTSAWLALGMEDIDATEGWIGLQEGVAVDTLYYTQGAAATDAYCKDRIRARLGAFAADPAVALRFYARKTTSQWNMPTFQSLSSSHNRVMRPRGVRWAEELLATGGALEPLYRAAADLALTQLWAWALVWLLLLRKDPRPEHLFFYVVFLGGFFFHLVWEAKARYTLVYAFLLLPCAWQGLCAVGAAPAPAAGSLRRAWPALAVPAVLLLSGISGQYLSCTRAEAAAQAAAYADWRAEQTPALPDGAHLLLRAADGAALSINADDPSAHLRADGPGTVLWLRPLHARLLLDSVPQTAACQILLDPKGTVALGMTSFEGTVFASQKPDPDPNHWNQQWLLRDLGGEVWALYILDKSGRELALTDAGDGSVVLTEYTGAAAQQWNIAPAV